MAKKTKHEIVGLDREFTEAERKQYIAKTALRLRKLLKRGECLYIEPGAPCPIRKLG